VRRPTAKPGNRIDLETVAASGSEGTNAGCAWQTLVAKPVELTGRSAPGIGNEVATAGIPVQNVLTTNATCVGPFGVTFTEADRAQSIKGGSLWLAATPGHS